MKKHFLIIGAGIAGTCTAVHLIKSGANVTIIDDNTNVSSHVAAGIINPIVFRRMTKSWRVDDFLPFLKSFYKEIEEKTLSSFLLRISIRRIFASKQEQLLWLEKEDRSDFSPYLEKITREDQFYSGAKNPFGSGRIKEAFCIDIPVFFESINKWIKENGTILFEHFDYKKLKGNTYKKTLYDGIIFCVGHKNKDCGYFEVLPIEQTKGQLLTIKSESLPENVSLNRKCFILPKGKKIFRIGSTYEWNNPTTNITKQGEKSILDSLSYITDECVSVLHQEAGIRPTTKDRRPMVGTHRRIKTYHILNGLGAKGYMLAPLISKEFVDYLMKGVELDPKINISRYYRKNNP